MPSFRVIVVENGERASQFVMPLERAPFAGEVIALPHGSSVTVRHVIDAPRGGLAGIILTWAADSDLRVSPEAVRGTPG